jgi:predicted protein tyrosine phosphatase
MDAGIQVFAQLELVEHLHAGREHYSHLISIGNPKQFLRKTKPDEKLPAIFKKHFKRVLRLEFFDVEEKRQLMWWQFPKVIPSRRHVRQAIRFFAETKGEASGYTIHCWQGISRSTAFALGLLYLLEGSEKLAALALKRIRPEAGPHQRIVRLFDEELGSHLADENDLLRKERFERLKKELAASADSGIEELEVAEEMPRALGGTLLNPAKTLGDRPQMINEEFYIRTQKTVDRLSETLSTLEKEIRRLKKT